MGNIYMPIWHFAVVWIFWQHSLLLIRLYDLKSDWRRANARNVSFLTFYGGCFTFSTQLLTLNYFMPLWLTDLMNVTEEVTIPRPNVSTLLYCAFLRRDLDVATRGAFRWSLNSCLKLPKIQKPGIPLRPIVSFVNSPTYAISAYLARILSPVVGNTDYTVKNSCEFADFIRDKTLNACEELVSFDVVSLFTRNPSWSCR